MKTRWKILIGVGIFLVLAVASAWMTAHHRPEGEVEAYKKFLRDRGEKLEMSELLPAPVPAESNGVLLAEEAFKLIDPGAEDYTNLPHMMRMTAPGKAMIGWMQPDLRETGSEGYTNSWENVLTAVEYNRPAVELLVQAAAFPAVDFHPDYSKGLAMLLPHLAPLKRGSQRMSAEAMSDLHAGNVPGAITNLCALLSLVQAGHDERVVISQLVRMSMSMLAVSANWELLQCTNLTDGELAALQKGWEQQEFIVNMERALEFERASNDETIQKIRTSKADYDCLLSAYTGGTGSASGWAGSGNWVEDAEKWGQDGFKSAKRGSADYLWRESWSYTDQLHALQGMQIVLEAMRTIQTNQIFLPTMNVAGTNLDALHDGFSDSGWMAEFNGWLGGPLREIFSGGMGFASGTIHKVLAAEMSRRVVITAIALKRFELRHGNYPEGLSGLVPEFLASVPLDAVDGKPLRYRRNPDGTFLLYSIGEDGVDDGGDTTPLRHAVSGSTANWNWQRGRDWVWPQPATVAEIQFFYDNPPK